MWTALAVIFIHGLELPTHTQTYRKSQWSAEKPMRKWNCAIDDENSKRIIKTSPNSAWKIKLWCVTWVLLSVRHFQWTIDVEKFTAASFADPRKRFVCFCLIKFTNDFECDGFKRLFVVRRQTILHVFEHFHVSIALFFGYSRHLLRLFHAIQRQTRQMQNNNRKFPSSSLLSLLNYFKKTFSQFQRLPDDAIERRICSLSLLFLFLVLETFSKSYEMRAKSESLGERNGIMWELLSRGMCSNNPRDSRWIVLIFPSADIKFLCLCSFIFVSWPHFPTFVDFSWFGKSKAENSTWST